MNALVKDPVFFPHYCKNPGVNLQISRGCFYNINNGN